MQFEHITCPHCGMLCDDLSVEVNGAIVKPLNIHHPACLKAYADACLNSDQLPPPRVGNKTTSLDDAIETAAAILKTARQPLVSGLIADVQTCRQALALTEKARGVIDHAGGALMHPNLAVMQRLGKVKTTLAEIRNRADHVIIFGSAILRRFPRLLERILLPDRTLGAKNTLNKTITVIDSLTEASQPPVKHARVNHMRIAAASLDEIIQTLQHIVLQQLDHHQDHDSAVTALIDIYQTIVNRHYTTFIWSSSLLSSEYAEQTIQTLTLTIKALMQKQRCVGLPLGGCKGEVTAGQVSTWQTGVPLPVNFNCGAPVHDPLLYNGKTMLENNEADCLVWIATYSPHDTAPDTDSPVIVIGHPNMQFKKPPAVFIPVGIPGIDTRGLACRTDSVATLPLQKIRAVDLASASDVLRNITHRL